MSLLEAALDPATVIVAVDPGKVSNRVWVSDGSALLTDPVSLPVAREGIRLLDRLLAEYAAVDPVICSRGGGKFAPAPDQPARGMNRSTDPSISAISPILWKPIGAVIHQQSAILPTSKSRWMESWKAHVDFSFRWSVSMTKCFNTSLT